MARRLQRVWCTPGSDRSSENVTFLRRKASVPLRRALGGATPLAAATADSGALSLDTEATLGRVKGGLFRAGGASAGGDAAPSRMRTRPPRCTHPVFTAQRGKGGVPTASIIATDSALPRPLMATISPGKTWLPLNVTIDANDRGDSPSSYRARALGTGDQEMSRGTT